MIISAGLTCAVVAQQAGLSLGRVHNLLYGMDASPVGRAKIEAATGLPLWSDPVSFNQPPVPPCAR